MNDFLAPKVRGRGQGDRPITEGRSQGPVSGPAPSSKLLPPTNRGQQPVERRQRLLDEKVDVPKVNYLGGATNILGSLGRALGGLDGLIEDNDTTGAELAKQLSDLVAQRDQGVIDGTTFTARSRAAYRSAVVTQPDGIDRFVKIGQSISGLDFGVREDNIDANQMQIDQINDFSGTVEGIVALNRARVAGLTGEAFIEYMNDQMVQVKALEAEVNNSGNILTLNKNDEESIQIVMRNTQRSITPKLTQNTQDLVDITFREMFDDDEFTVEDLTALNELKLLLTTQYSEQYSRIAGTRGEDDFKDSLEQALLPLTVLESTIDGNMEDINALLKSKGSEAALKAMTVLADNGINPIISNNPQFLQTVMEMLPVTDALLYGKSTKALLDSVDSQGQYRADTATNDDIDMSSVHGRAKLNKVAADPQMRDNIYNTNKRLLDQLDVRDEDSVQAAQNWLTSFNLAIIAGDDVFDPVVFQNDVLPNVDKFKAILEFADEDQESVIADFNKTWANQWLRNIKRLEILQVGLPDGMGFEFDEDGLKRTFDAELFKESDNEVNVAFRKLLKARGLAATEDNLLNVADNLRMSASQYQNLVNKRPDQNDPFTLADRAIVGQIDSDKMDQYNNLMAQAQQIWFMMEEVGNNDIFKANALKVNTPKIASATLTDEDMKTIETFQVFANDLEADKAFEEGRIKPGEMIRVGRLIGPYIVEEDTE